MKVMWEQSFVNVYFGTPLVGYTYINAAHLSAKSNSNVQKCRWYKYEQDYQKAHHPEKHRDRFSKTVACSISFWTCSLTDKATSGLKSRPVILCCTRLYTASARSLRTSWAPPSRPSSFWKSKYEVSLNEIHLPLKISFSSALSFRIGPWGCAAALVAVSAARAGDISVSANTLIKNHDN